MNILFLTLLDFNSLQEKNIYTDLLRVFVDHGHNIYAISPVERRNHQKTRIIKENNNVILKLCIGNTQKTNVIKKGICTLSIEPKFISAIKKYFSDIKFDMVLYSTPPITFCNAIRYVKNRDQAKTYLMLKDIFPQNAVDLGMMTKSGIKGLIYKFFRNKEKKLYAISDTIGCMSQANVDYLIRHNPDISPEKVEICPNCVEVQDAAISESERISLRKQYNIPLDRKVFVYGGNLGRPQGIPFLIECLKSQENNDKAFFLIVGDGTERNRLEEYISESKPKNIRLIELLPKEDYDRLIAACDVGLIFLDHRFTIPNFPSRLLSYMQVGMPVIACTDSSTDIGKVIVEGGFGWWCESSDTESFKDLVNAAVNTDTTVMKQRSHQYLEEHYNSDLIYKIISKDNI